MMKLSIIILSWNTKELLKQCLESVISYQLPVTGEKKKLITDNRSLITEIIVVDNGSTDGSVEYLRSVISYQLPVTGEKKKLITDNRSLITIKQIENKENLGFSKGNNIGIKAATGKYIMLLNSDTIVQKGALEKLVEYLEKNPQTAVSPLLELPDGKPQLDYYMCFPNLWQIFFYHNPLLRPLVMKLPFKKIIYQETKEHPFEVDQLPGAALMAGRETWQKVGELDPDFKFLWEDVDWSWRAKKEGVKLMVLPQAKITHIGGASWKKKLSQDKNLFYKQFFASMLLFVERNYNSFSLFAFTVALLLNFLLTFKISLFLSLLRGDLKQEKLWK